MDNFLTVILPAVLLRSLFNALPLILATQGQILTERSGVLNLGVEGMMAIGALGAYLGVMSGGPVAGLLLAFLLAAMLGLIHAALSVGFRANQTISGLAITMLGTGLASLWGKSWIGKPCVIHLSPWPFAILALVVCLVVWFVLRHTRAGLVIRACGENPRAAEASGSNVALVRLVASTVGAGIIGLSGAFLSLAYQTSWIEGMTNGRGWLVVALVIFSLWRPGRAVWGSFLFAFTFVLQYMLQPLGIPPNLLNMLPYAGTLLFMIIYGLVSDHRKMAAPAALGEAYRRGER